MKYAVIGAGVSGLSMAGMLLKKGQINGECLRESFYESEERA